MVQLRLFAVALFSLAILSNSLGVFSTSAFAAKAQLHVTGDQIAQIDLGDTCADDEGTNCPAACSSLHWLSPSTVADGAKPKVIVFVLPLDQQALSYPGELDPPPPR